VFEFKGGGGHGAAEQVLGGGGVLLYSRLTTILTNAAASRSSMMLASKRRELRSNTHQVASKYAGPTLFLSSSQARQTSSFASRLGPLDQLHETWHQEMWQLKDAASHVAKSRYEWHPPLVW
jgi:hypothetical protein